MYYFNPLLFLFITIIPAYSQEFSKREIKERKTRYENYIKNINALIDKDPFSYYQHINYRYQDLTQAFPDSLDAHYIRGYAAYLCSVNKSTESYVTRYYNDAVLYFNLYESKGGKNHEYLRYRGMCYYNMNNFNNACKDLEKYLKESNNTDKEILRIKANVDRIRAIDVLKKQVDSLKSSHNFIGELEPLNKLIEVDSLNKIGYSDRIAFIQMFHCKDYAEADKWYTKLEELDPSKAPEYWYYRGQCRINMGNLNAGCIDLHNSAQMNFGLAKDFIINHSQCKTSLATNGIDVSNYSNSASSNNDKVYKIYYRGPKGGCYYINSNGAKVYVDRSYCR